MLKKLHATTRVCLALLLSLFSTNILPVQVAYAANAGDIKVVDELGDVDDIPNNDPMLDDCDLVVEFYNFDNTGATNSTVSFTPQAPTADVTVNVTGDTTPTIAGDGDADGQGNNDEDGTYVYTLSFVGASKTQGNTTGYHVDLDIDVEGTNGGDKQKMFWMPASCQATATPDEPTSTPITCDEDGSYTIPSTENVRYLVSIDGAPAVETAAGTYPVTTDQIVVITAEALDGYVLDGENEWTFEFTAPTDCEPPVEEPELTVDFDDSVCTATANDGIISVTIENDEEAGNATGLDVVLYDDEGVEVATITDVDVAAGEEKTLTFENLPAGTYTAAVFESEAEEPFAVSDELEIDDNCGGSVGGDNDVCPNIDGSQLDTALCPPGQGGGRVDVGGASTTRTTPQVLPATLPATGGSTSPLALILAMLTVYGAVYFLQGRRNLIGRFEQ